MRVRSFLCVMSGLRGCVPGPFRGLFFRCEHLADDGAIQFVSDFHHLAAVGFFVDGEGWQVTFLPEHLVASLSRKVAFQIALAISGLVAMADAAPGENADLVE